MYSSSSRPSHWVVNLWRQSSDSDVVSRKLECLLSWTPRMTTSAETRKWVTIIMACTIGLCISVLLIWSIPIAVYIHASYKMYLFHQCFCCSSPPWGGYLSWYCPYRDLFCESCATSIPARTRNFCEFCTTFIPVPGTSVSPLTSIPVPYIKTLQNITLLLPSKNRYFGNCYG